MAFLTHMAAHGAQGHEQLRYVLCTIAAGSSKAVQQMNLVVFTDLLGIPGDFIYGSTTDLGSPFGRLGSAIVLTQNVILKVFVQLGIGRHHGVIETNGASL